jgi:hypothetical protein
MDKYRWIVLILAGLIITLIPLPGTEAQVVVRDSVEINNLHFDSQGSQNANSGNRARAAGNNRASLSAPFHMETFSGSVSWSGHCGSYTSGGEVTVIFLLYPECYNYRISVTNPKFIDDVYRMSDVPDFDFYRFEMSDNMAFCMAGFVDIFPHLLLGSCIHPRYDPKLSTPLYTAAEYIAVYGLPCFHPFDPDSVLK